MEIHTNCIICNGLHPHQDCTLIQITGHVADNKVPSRAKMTLPACLRLDIISDGSYSVISKSEIKKGTKFGPFLAARTHSTPSSFPLGIFLTEGNEDLNYFLDISDENQCSWLIFINPAESIDDQNMICYQEDKEIYYVSCKDIAPETALKVWYSPYYAQKMNKPLLTKKVEFDALRNVDINALVKKQQKIIDRKSWTCKFCSHMESNVVAFASHMLKHYTAQSRKMCEICKAGFYSKKSLAKHLKIVHKSVAQPEPLKLPEVFRNEDCAPGGPLLNNMFTDSSDLNLAMESQNSLLDMTDNLMVENYLDETVKELEGFNFNIEANHQYVCDICLKQFGKLKLLILHLRHHTGEFVCHTCLKIFCRRENFTNHSCNSTLSFTCDFCQKSYSQKKYLSRHLAAIHLNRFACVDCKKVYHSRTELKEHNCRKLSNEQKEKFACNTCGKEFLRQTYLRQHLKTHLPKTNHKPILKRCEVCGKTVSKNSYYLHVKIHQEPKFGCDTCGKKFSRKDALNEHILSHNTNSEFECDICHKKFKTKKILSVHTKNHNVSKKTHKCSMCALSFKFSHSLRKHIKSAHSTDKDSLTISYFICPICNKTVKLESSLRRHLKRAHPNSTNHQSITVTKQTFPKEVSNIQKEIDAQIENLLNDDNIINNASVDSLVEELDRNGKRKEEERRQEVCLSIPDLTEKDQEITLDRNAYILENGTIVQPQANSDNVIIYVLNESFM